MSQDTSNATNKQDTGKGKKKPQPFSYDNNQDYINRQVRRARWLLRWFIGGLGITIVIYFAFHLHRPEGILRWRPLTQVSEWQEIALDWVLWSLAGTLIYLLFEIGRYYPVIGENAPKRTWSFIEYTPWYLVTLVKGPIIAVVILFFFKEATLGLTGDEGAFRFDFSKLDHRVTLLLAFVLGFYSRVAKHVLDGIVKSLFAGAWAKAHGEFEIEPSEAKVVLGETMVFKTTPTTDVVWAASLGTIDATGKYSAPKQPEHCGAKVVITAVSTGTQSIARSATVTLVPFKIEGPTEVELGPEPMQYAYRVSPAADKVTWAISPKAGGGSIDDKGVYTAPSEKEAKTDKVTITATTKKKDATGKERDCSDSLEVKLKKKKEGGQ